MIIYKLMENAYSLQSTRSFLVLILPYLSLMKNDPLQLNCTMTCFRRHSSKLADLLNLPTYLDARHVEQVVL